MGFGAPLLLLGLLALPAIWWLLRTTPPLPQREVFPPLRLLLLIVNRKETPNRTPWWLLLLRLLCVGLVICAFAEPIWRPQQLSLSGKQPLALIVDNGWSAANDWQTRIRTANKLLDQADILEKPVYLVATAGTKDQDIGPASAKVIKQRLNDLKPQPLPTHRLESLQKLVQQSGEQQTDIAYLSDGLQTFEDVDAFALLNKMHAQNILIYQEKIDTLFAINTLKNENGAITADLIRGANQGEQKISLGVYDSKNRRIGETQASFSDGETQTLAVFDLPLELRNDAMWIHIDQNANAAATFLADNRNKLYRVALLSSSPNEMTQPLLSPLYYVNKALQGRADIVMAGSGAFTADVERLLAQNPSVFVMGDIVNMPQATEAKLSAFVEAGGTLIRFAGQNLASSEQDDSLLPVVLRHGERQLGGIMSWATPQKLAPFAKDGLFADLQVPDDVTVSRQILAEPGPDLFEKSWINLADGTPLVTAANKGQGKLIFIHTSPDPSWSTLPLSGFFVDMMQRLIEIGASHNNSKTVEDTETFARAPWRILGYDGQLRTPPVGVTPLILNAETPALPSFNHPPGLYGTENNLYAVNLLDASAQLLPIEMPVFSSSSQQLDYDNKDEVQLSGILLGLAALLFALDSFIVLGLGGIINKRKHMASLVMVPVLFGSFILYNQPVTAQAQQLSSNDSAMVQSAGKTRLAYVITGNNDLDDTSKTGLEALSQFIQSRTTISPGPVAGVDLDKDELAFYPLIYWPIDPNGPMPTQQAIEKINAFMRQGGTVLFDTRDQMTTGLDLKGGASPATTRLREILDGLNIPALEQSPPDHVISRSFYIMPDFPGRYRGSPLWIESSAMGTNDNKPIHAGDGVSSILITANDMAAAWSHDGKGAWKYPLVPDDQMQRIWAFRGGLNIVMYMLTGNYKADQVHVPALLQRLGKERDE